MYSRGRCLAELARKPTHMLPGMFVSCNSSVWIGNVSGQVSYAFRPASFLKFAIVALFGCGAVSEATRVSQSMDYKPSWDI